MKSPVVIGVLAGLAFGLLYFLPLPGFIAGLGWGPLAAAIAVAVAALLVTATSGVTAGFTHVITFGIPVLIICHIAFLNRWVPSPQGSESTQPDQDETGPDGAADKGGTREWYPLGRIVAWTLLMSGVLALIATLSLGSSFERYQETVRAALDVNLLKQLERLTGQPLGADDKAAMIAFMVQRLPGMLSMTWLLLTLPSLWLAGRITKASGLLARPWEPVPAMQYPGYLPLVFAATLVASQVPGLFGVIAGGFASALMLGYFILGLAILHYVTRTNPMRAFILAPAYAALPFFGQIGGILLAIVGVGEHMFHLRQRADAARSGRPPTT